MKSIEAPLLAGRGGGGLWGGISENETDFSHFKLTLLPLSGTRRKRAYDIYILGHDHLAKLNCYLPKTVTSLSPRSCWQVNFRSSDTGACSHQCQWCFLLGSFMRQGYIPPPFVVQDRTGTGTPHKRHVPTSRAHFNIAPRFKPSEAQIFCCRDLRRGV